MTTFLFCQIPSSRVIKKDAARHQALLSFLAPDPHFAAKFYSSYVILLFGGASGCLPEWGDSSEALCPILFAASLLSPQ